MGVCWCGRPVSTPQHVETTETQPCTHWPVLCGLHLVIQLYGMYLWQSDIEVLQCPAPPLWPSICTKSTEQRYRSIFHHFILHLLIFIFLF